MKLADLIDLEVQLAKDEATRREALSDASQKTRDAAIGRLISKAVLKSESELRRELDDQAALRKDVAIRWIEELRASEAKLPGQRIEEGLVALSALLCVFGALIGASAGLGFLHYDGSRPVNVFGFLALFCGVQCALLLAALALMLFSRRKDGGPPRNLLMRWLKNLSRARFIDRLAGGKMAELDAKVNRLLAHHKILNEAEGWILFGLVQRFGTWFNIGATLVFVYLLAFTDLAFGWSTTFAVEGASFHALTEMVSLPFAALWPEARPSLDLVQWTQWAAHDGGGYVREAPPSGRPTGGWWPFLLMGLIVYGLLPRALALFFANHRQKQALRRARLDHAGYERLFDRLFTGQRADWDSPAPEAVGRIHTKERGPSLKKQRTPAEPVFAPDPQAVEESREKAPLGQALAPPHILWGSLAEESGGDLLRSFGRDTSLILCAGGDLSSETRDLASLKAAKERRAVLLVEAGVQPTKEVLGYLRRARALLEPPAAMSVLLFDRDASGSPIRPRDEDLLQWQLRFDAEGDLYLRLEPWEPRT